MLTPERFDMSTQRMAGVYRLHCPATGHNYIGATTNLEVRYTTHFRELRRRWHNTVKLRDAALAHGADGFTWEVIDSFPMVLDGGWAAKMLCVGERHWHHYYLSLAPDLLASSSHISFNLAVRVQDIAPLDVVRPLVWAWEEKYGRLYEKSDRETIAPSLIAYRKHLERD